MEECIYEPLKPISGAVSAEHGIGLEKKNYLHISRSETEINLMKSLKKALDPNGILNPCLLYTSPSPRDRTRSRMPSSA